MLDPITFVPLISACVHLFMFSYIFGQKQKAPVNYAFLVISGGLFIICVQEFLIYQPIPTGTAEFLGRFSMFMLLVVAIANLYFAYAIVRQGKIDSVFKVLTAGMLITSTFCFFVEFFKIHAIPGADRVSPNLLYLFMFLPITLSLFRIAHLLLIGWKKGETTALRNQCRLLFSGNILSIVLSLMILVILPIFFKNMNFYRFSSFTSLITIVFIYRAMQRYGLMVVDIATIKNVSDMLFGKVNYGIIVTDKNNLILQSNKLAADILGQPEKIVDFDMVTRMLPDVDFNTRFTGQIVDFSIGDCQRFLEISHADFGESHPQLGSMIFLRDVTEQRRRDVANADKLRLESLGRLAGGVAHDFNNQLTGIMGCADLLRENLSSQPEIRQLADIIVEAAGRSARLTRQMLAFSRRGNFQNVMVDMCAVVDDTISILEHSIDKRIKINRHFTAALCTVTGDPEQLHHTILNIALNARDAMPDGGNLDFNLTNIEKVNTTDDRTGAVSSPKNHVRIAIKDTGIGISPELQSKVFEPFFTTKEKGKGTGLGLAAAYGTIHAHHGTILLQSDVGKGTEVIIEIPATLPPATVDTIGSKTPIDGNPLKNLRILIVEDEPVVIAQLRETLHRAGIGTNVFERGNEALTYYKGHWKDIDLVLLDLVLPDSTGHQVFSGMKAINLNVRVLLSSGFTIDGGVQQILDDGALGFIQKPYRSAELLAKVREVAQKKG